MYVTLKSDSYEDLCLANPRVDLCFKDVNRPMINKRMKLNQEKKDLVVTSFKYWPRPALDSIQVGEENSAKVPVQNLLTVFDQWLNDHERAVM